MRMKKLAYAALYLFSGIAVALAGGSTIDPTIPAQNSPLTSAPIRQNFQAAYTDINNLITQNGSASAPVSPLQFQIWVNTTANPYPFSFWDGAQWVLYGTLDNTTHAWTPAGGTVPSGTTGGLAYYAGPTTLASTAVPTNHGVLLGKSVGAAGSTAAMTDGQVLVGQTGADPLPKTVSGDAALAASGALTVSKLNGSTPGVAAVAGQVVTSINSSGVGTLSTESAVLDGSLCSTQGSVAVRQAAGWTCLGPATTGQVLATQGTGNNLAWVDAINSFVQPTALYGYTLSNDGTNPTTTIDIAVGAAMDSTNTVWIRSASPFTKLMKTQGGTTCTSTFVQGSGQCGMVSAIGNNISYSVFAIICAGSFDIYFDGSVTAANKPACATSWRRIGYVTSGGSANIRLFLQVYDRFILNSPLFECVCSVTTSRQSVNTTAPPNVEAKFRLFYNDSASASSVIVGPTYEANIGVPTGSNAPGLSLRSLASNNGTAGDFQIFVDGNQSWFYMGNFGTGGTLEVVLIGWVDYRGKQ